MIGQVGLVLFSLLIWRGTSILWYGVGYFFLGGYRLCRAMSVAIVQPIVREREVGLAFGAATRLNLQCERTGPPVLEALTGAPLSCKLKTVRGGRLDAGGVAPR